MYLWITVPPSFFFTRRQNLSTGEKQVVRLYVQSDEKSENDECFLSIKKKALHCVFFSIFGKNWSWGKIDKFNLEMVFQFFIFLENPPSDEKR